MRYDGHLKKISGTRGPYVFIRIYIYIKKNLIQLVTRKTPQIMRCHMERVTCLCPTDERQREPKSVGDKMRAFCSENQR